MTKRTTRRTEYSQEAGTLFMAFELSFSEWKLAFSIGLGQKPRGRSVPARDLPKLRAEIAAAKERFGLPPSARVVSCFEAGRDGFWLHRFLVEAGIENLVVDSSSIEVNRRARRAKSDGLDVEKLLLMLMRYDLGERKVWSVLRVPSVDEEDARQLHRELRTLKKERTRSTNRIRGLLAGQGIKLEKVELSPSQLNQLRLWDGKELPAGLKGRLQREWERVALLRRQILDLEAERRQSLREIPDAAVEKVRQLTTLCGIGDQGAWVLVREFFGWRKFKNRREVGCLAGLTSTHYQSGESNREQGISKAGNRHVRELAVELAWLWLRHQPKSKLSRWYEERFAGGGSKARRVGIVAVARRLLIDLWRFLEMGVIPEGAELKA